MVSFSLKITITVSKAPHFKGAHTLAASTRKGRTREKISTRENIAESSLKSGHRHFHGKAGEEAKPPFVPVLTLTSPAHAAASRKSVEGWHLASGLPGTKTDFSLPGREASFP